MPRNIDELDEQIISKLQVDGRRPAADIAREIGVPRATAQRRIESLESDGVIAIKAYANAEGIGLPVHVWIVLRVALDSVVFAAEVMSGFKELRWVGIVSGGSNILAEAFFSSNQHAHAFFTQRLASVVGIQQVETLHVLSLEKFAFDWTSMRHASEDYDWLSTSQDNLVAASNG